jgi:glutamyl-tRNA synthetase
VGADGSPLSKRHGSTSVNEFRERGFLSIALLNQLFHLGHASDLEVWLEKESMPAHFRPEHLGRAAARFDEAQLTHWQKESLAHLDGAGFAAWLGSGAQTAARGAGAAFIELIRHNVVLPADAAPWFAAVDGELPPLGAAERDVIAAAGPGFFSAAVGALAESGQDLKTLTKLLKERTGRKGADLFMPLRVALTGQLHGPELGRMLELIPLPTVRRRLASHAQNS